MEVLRVQSLNKKFGEFQALKDISLTVNQGEVFALIGPSGSGKSTLLRCINCLEMSDSGSIWINGIYLAKDENGKSVYLPEDELRHARLKLGMVFQNFNLFPHLNVLDNLTLAPVMVNEVSKETAESSAMEILEKMDLVKKAKNYPFELSGGQCQRVAIARALAMNPDILCFDEPTSALDPELTNEVLKVIHKLAQDKMTMLIVTHEMNFAREVAATVAFMDESEIIEFGTPDSIMKESDNPRIRAFFEHIKGDFN